MVFLTIEEVEVKLKEIDKDNTIKLKELETAFKN